MTPKQALINQTTYPTTLTTAEEKKGNSALKAALDLHERGAKSGWAQPGAKDRALDAYMQSAEVCVLGASLQQKLAGRRFFHQTTIFCCLSFWKPYPMCYPKKSSARPTANHKSTRLKLVSFLPFFFWPLHCLVGVSSSHPPAQQSSARPAAWQSFFAALRVLKQQQPPGASGVEGIKRIEAKCKGVLSRAEDLKGVAKARLRGHYKRVLPFMHLRSACVTVVFLTYRGSA